MPDDKDKELVRRLKRGDKDALRIIYERYKDELVALAVSLLYDISLAEDVLHDVFVKFAECVVKLKLRVSLKSYLRACVVNRIRDLWKRSRIRVGEIKSKSSDCVDPYEWARLDEASQHVARAMAQLAFEKRAVIILHVQEDMTFQDISFLLRISENTVKTRYKRGMKKLRELLDRQIRSQESA